MLNRDVNMIHTNKTKPAAYNMCPIQDKVLKIYVIYSINLILVYRTIVVSSLLLVSLPVSNTYTTVIEMSLS